MHFRLITAAIAAVSCFCLGILAYRRNRDSALAKYFAIFNFFLGIWNISDLGIALAPPSTTLIIDRFSYVLATLIVPSFVYLSLELVGREIPRRLALLTIHLPALFLLASAFTPWLISDVKTIPNFQEVPGPIYFVFAIYLLWGIGYGVFQTFLGYRKTMGIKKNQLRYAFLGFFFGFWAAVDYLVTMAIPAAPPIYYLFETIYTTLIFLAIIKYKLMDINLAFRYATIGVYLSLILGAPFSLAIWLLTKNYGAATLGLLGPLLGHLSARRIRSIVTSFVDQLPPFRGRYQSLAEVPGLQKAISSSANVKQWAKNVVDSLNRLVEIENVGIFIYDEGPGSYFAVDALGVDFGQMYYASPGAGHPLIGQLKRSQKILQKEYVDFEVEKSERQDVLAAMEMLKASLCVPFFSGGEMIGFVSVGRKLKRARTHFEESQVSEGAIEDLLKFPVGVTENVAYVTGLLREELGEGAGLGGRRVTEGLNRLVSRTDWVKGVPKPEALGLRCEGTALLHRWRQSGRLTPVERETLNAAMVAAVYRGELVDYEQEETFNDEDLRTIWGLIQGAEAALMVILVTLAGQMKTAEWAHDLRHPFTKGSFRMLDEVLSGRQGPLTEKQAQTLSLIRSDAHFVEKHITDIVAPETAGEMKIKKVSATGLVRWVETRYKYVAALSGIELKGVVPESEGWVLCDGELIQYRVFNNLMDNALRHTPRGGAIEVSL